MENNGWIKLHRKLLNSRVFQNEGLLKVWVWCLLKATHEEQWVSIKTGKGKTEIWVPVGSFIFGRLYAGKELKMKPSTAWDRILKLQRLEIIVVKSDTLCSLISITNWIGYQGEQIKGDSHPTAIRQPSDTYKNDKNKNTNTINTFNCDFFSVDLKHSEQYKKTYPGVNLEQEYEKMVAWLISNPQKQKTARGYYRFINNWLSNAFDKLDDKREEKKSWRDDIPWV